jgi:poly-gamma-glutamate capsule biosynthesis protein CapA/YwtB (metallophosphatase superfamily)
MRTSEIVMAAGGDISLAGTVTDSLERFDAGWVFERLAPALTSADLFTANLESPILPDGAEPGADALVVPEKLLNASFAARLPRMAVTLANNHAFDAGPDGVACTRRKLGEIGIACFGAGADARTAGRPRFVDVNGLRIGFLGRTEDSPQIHGKRFPGPAVMRYPQLLRDVRDAAARCDALIVHLHQGVEFIDWPGPHMVRLCRELAAAGARVVIGNHPHVPQGWERAGRRRRSVIFYSLGDLVFDVAHTRYLRRGSPWTARSVIAMIPLTRSSAGDPTLVPYWITNAGRPIPLKGHAADEVRRHVAMLSTDLRDPGAMREHWRETAVRCLAIYLRLAGDVLNGAGTTREVVDHLCGCLALDESRAWIRELVGGGGWLRKLTRPSWT